MPGTGIHYQGKFLYQSSLQKVIKIKVTSLSVSIYYRPVHYNRVFYCTAFLITIQPKVIVYSTVNSLDDYKVPNVFREGSVRSLPSKVKRNSENSCTVGARPENNEPKMSHSVPCITYQYSGYIKLGRYHILLIIYAYF